MDTQTPQTASAEHQAEAGFSLIEVLIAIVVLVFGIISVANLMVVAAANNMSANQGSAAVSAAVQEMEMIKATPFANLAPGVTVREVGLDATPGRDERTVARIHVIRNVTPVVGAAGTLFITVTATPVTALNARANIDPNNPPVTRSQAVFTSFRTVEGQ